MNWINGIFEKTGVVGTLTAAMGCAACFPALGSLASALGLGFLAQFEGLFINTLLPVFAVIALVANLFSYFSHKVWFRTLAGISGPIMVLLTLYPLWSYNWSTYLFYAGIALMVHVSIWDVLSPPYKKNTKQFSPHTIASVE